MFVFGLAFSRVQLFHFWWRFEKGKYHEGFRRLGLIDLCCFLAFFRKLLENPQKIIENPPENPVSW